MNPSYESAFSECLVDELNVDDEASFRHVALYAELKQVLRDAGYRFRVLPSAYAGRWDRTQLLNLSYWGADSGGDVLVDRQLPVCNRSFRESTPVVWLPLQRDAGAKARPQQRCSHDDCGGRAFGNRDR